MKREEFLTKLQALTAIEVPTEDQEKVINELADAVEVEGTAGRIAELEKSLADKEAKYKSLEERYKDLYWHGKSGSDDSHDDDDYEEEDEPEIPSFDQLF